MVHGIVVQHVTAQALIRKLECSWQMLSTSLLRRTGPVQQGPAFS